METARFSPPPNPIRATPCFRQLPGSDGLNRSYNALQMRVDFRVEPGPDGPRITVSCPDRTSVAPLSQLLPALQSLTNKVVDAAVERERKAGRKISCKAGCGACCRQLVPISRTEARELPDLIASLSEAHRSRVMARFSDTVSKLRVSGIWDRLEKYSTLPRDERVALGTEYFQLGIACPFLEDESCSIHAVRPLVCRQYLVTSPAANCTNPTPKTIAAVALGANVIRALTRVEAGEANKPRPVPLVLAPFLNVDEDESKNTALAWMRLLLGQIKKIRDEQIAAKTGDSENDNAPEGV